MTLFCLLIRCECSVLYVFFIFYVQHLTMLRGFSPPAQQPPWRWPSLCPPVGAWSHSWVTAAPCTLGPAGVLWEGNIVNEMQICMAVVFFSH